MTPYDMIKTQLGGAVPFARHAGAQLTSVGDGTGAARLAQTEASSNHVGTQHAGALFTLGETASGAAVAGALAPEILATRLVATSARIDYQAPALGTITATAQTERPGADLLAELREAGRAVFAVQVALTDEAGKQVATLTVDWHARKAS